MKKLEFYTNKWPAGTGLDGKRHIARHFHHWHLEMAEHGENLDDALFIHYSFDLDYQQFDPTVLAIWTKRRVYFPVGECCYSVESAPFPPGVWMPKEAVLKCGDFPDEAISLPMFITLNSEAYMTIRMRALTLGDGGFQPAEPYWGWTTLEEAQRDAQVRELEREAFGE